MLQAADDDAGRAHILLSDIIVLVRQAVVNASLGRSGSQQAFVLTSGAALRTMRSPEAVCPLGPSSTRDMQFRAGEQDGKFGCAKRSGESPGNSKAQLVIARSTAQTCTWALRVRR